MGDGRSSAEVLAAAMAAADDQQTAPVMPTKSDKRKDDIAFALHLMSGEELLALAAEIAGERNSFAIARDLFEWHLKRINGR